MHLKGVQMQHVLDSLVTNMAEAVEEMAKDYENSKKTNLEMKAVLDSLVTNMKANIEKLSGDVEVMRPRKRIGVSIDDGERPLFLANGWKKRNLLMHDKFDSFMTDMTETVQKLSDLLVVENGNDVDDTSLTDEDTKNTTSNTGHVVVAEKTGIAKITNSTSKSSSSAVASKKHHNHHHQATQKKTYKQQSPALTHQPSPQTSPSPHPKPPPPSGR